MRLKKSYTNVYVETSDAAVFPESGACGETGDISTGGSSTFGICLIKAMDDIIS